MTSQQETLVTELEAAGGRSQEELQNLREEMSALLEERMTALQATLVAQLGDVETSIAEQQQVRL